MNTRRTNTIALLCAAAFLFAAGASAQDFPAYLTMEGTKITGCDQAALPANLVIPEGVTEIGYDAFHGCISLATVSIPTSVTKISSLAFYGCDNIKTVQYRGTLAQWCQIDNDVHLVRKANTITMSDVVDLKAMTALAIPNGVAEIGGYAFFGCASLATVSIPSNVTAIGGFAFLNCDNLKTVQYGGTLAQWCEMDNDSYLVANAKTITLSDIVDLKAITTLAIPNEVAKIGESAFYGCKSLATVTIPTSVTEIGPSAFGRTSIAGVMIPESVTKIGGGAFENCKLLATASISASVAEIGWGAFGNCDNIKTVQYRGTLAQWCQMNNDGQLVANAKTITMSDLVDLKAMTALAIPESITKIGEYAFYGCKSLASVTLPASVTEIGKGAFGGCISLVSITIPDGVTEIGWDAFERCESLANVTIPSSVTEIGEYAFYDCTSLTKIVFTGTKTQWQVLYVPLPLGAVVRCSDGDYVQE